MPVEADPESYIIIPTGLLAVLSFMAFWIVELGNSISAPSGMQTKVSSAFITYKCGFESDSTQCCQSIDAMKRSQQNKMGSHEENESV